MNIPLNMNRDLKEEVYRLLDEGMRAIDIARRLNCSRGMITYYKFRRNSPDRLGKNIPLTTRQINEINNLYLAGKSFSEIRDATGFCIQTVRKYLTVPRRPKEKQRRTIYKIRWALRKKAILVQYKGGKCAKCGYDKCIEALHFHHVDPSQKEFSVCSASYSIDRLKKEADKCILLCSNCHIEEHYCKTCEEAFELGRSKPSKT